jgi:5-methylthioadenosine/S-adenosylhomocysteine deaminase
VSERVLVRAARAFPAAGEPPVEDAGILIEDGAIASLGPFEAVRRSYPRAREHDARHLVALPGLVDAHSHGRAIPLSEQGVREGPLELFLAQLTALTPLDRYDDAFVAGSDLLATGVTAVQVFFDGLADDADAYRRAAAAVADGLAASGIEFELVLGFTDQDEFVPGSATDIPDAAAGLAAPHRGMGADEFLAVFDAWVAERPATIGPIAAQWCSDRALEGMGVRVRAGARVHTHLLESRAQREVLVPSPVARLRQFGLLCDRLSAAHAVWLTPQEIAECAAAGTVLVHCPGSNRRLAGGAAPTRAWLDAGVTGALGLDSYSRVEPADAFEELRLAGEAVGARDALGMATLGGAAALGRPELGRLAPGSAASLVLLAAPGDPLDLTTRHDVVEVWVRGTRLVQDGRLRARREVEAARSRLREQLAADATGRRARLAAVSALEPWLAEAWSLDSVGTVTG